MNLHVPAASSLRAWPRPWHREIRLRSESLCLIVALYFALLCNGPFWQQALESPLRQWSLALSLFVLLVALHALLLGLFVNRWTARPLLATVFLFNAGAVHYMHTYGVYMDADMLRNVLNTDVAEATELLSWRVLPALFVHGLLPITLLWRVRLERRPWRRALPVRVLFLAGLLAMAASATAINYQALSTLMRNQHELRWLATPGNWLVSLAGTLAEPPPHAKDLLPVAEDARQSPRLPGQKPRLLVLVLGETARAANWGLNGYTRQTTPQLAARSDLVNFSDVLACGSSTEVSVPCLFSPFGRADYDRDTIRAHESLLHVLARAGVGVLWRDNQSGCKGVCAGLPTQALQNGTDPRLCNGARCLDEVLLHDLPAQWTPDGRDRIVVLHMLGSHGPNYFERYPTEFARFQPACASAEPDRCDRAQIVNAYDNSLLYTDQVLARTIDLLARQDAYDTAMLYVSDHGESLGEKGLYLHGMPYAIAPREQLQVPMTMWFSPGFTRSAGLDIACLRGRARQPASHDNLFPSLLGLFDVHSTAYSREHDLFATCRSNTR